MIGYALVNGSIALEQRLDGPTVYLDHWALRLISTKPELKRKFVEALLRKNGTLAISWVNLSEFSKVSDLSQAQAAEDLVESLIPNLFFLEANPYTVIDREDAWLSGNRSVLPHADMDFLKAVAGLGRNALSGFSSKNMFQVVVEAGPSERLASLAATFVERTEALRAEIDSDETLQKLLRKRPHETPHRTSTRHVIRELLRDFFIDHSLKITPNHAIDSFHSCVPGAYCDFILVDGHWKDKIERAKRRFEDAGLEINLAKPFSARNQGVGTFLAELNERDSKPALGADASALRASAPLKGALGGTIWRIGMHGVGAILRKTNTKRLEAP